MAGRREKLRRVGIIPEYRGFTPDGLASGDAIYMTVDELEVLRLCDLEGLNQEAVAQQTLFPIPLHQIPVPVPRTGFHGRPQGGNADVQFLSLIHL